MDETGAPKHGVIAWVDLTVPNAEAVRDFYREVVGWSPTAVDMGGYSDYCMNHPDTGATVAGVCHARGVNQDLPPQWILYLTVPRLDEAVAKVETLGGSLVRGPTAMGEQGRYAVVRDPGGAVVALFQPA